MDKGLYVRCPLIIEAADEQFPRAFVFAQVIEYNELSDAVRVDIHDLFGSRKYYPHIFDKTVFPREQVVRCSAMAGSRFESPRGGGSIIDKAAETDAGMPYIYLVRFDNGVCGRLAETEMKIDYSKMDYSPLEQLKNYEFQNPTWYSNRIKVSRNAHIMRNASYGFDVLAGCRTFLLPHQISTISRCFEFMPIRYMLADEVGLGKTIEACGILKIMLSENPTLRILFILPGALINQWKNELRYKFAIDIDCNSNCTIAAMEDLTQTPLLGQQWDILLVDEAHRLLQLREEYTIALQLSRQSEHILLLSATPIQDRKEEYLRLLSLLNPQQYEAMPAEHFSSLVKKQKSIQRSVNQLLKRMERYDQYREAIVEKLVELCDSLEDPTLRKILARIDVSGEDAGQEAAAQALSYICENYRLERKVIRNRRDMLASKMAVRTVEAVSYAPAAADDLYNEVAAIESVMSYLTEASDGTAKFAQTIAVPLLSALYSSPWALAHKLKQLGITDAGLHAATDIWREQAEYELNDADGRMDDPDLIKGRFLKALDYIEANTDILTDPSCKIVVFTSHNETLKKFSSVAKRRLSLSHISVVEFGEHMDRDSLEDSVYDFQNHDDCRMIICDELGGEGRNFQNAAIVVHLDIPWNANALEQRIGRLDRLGRDVMLEVLSVVIHTENTSEQQLFNIWKDGMRIFEQSLSGLEIITGELNSLITRAISEDFYNGLSGAFDDILATTEEMRESVLDEQLFDVGTTIYRPLGQAVAKLLGSYTEQEDNIFADSMMNWAHQVGLEGQESSNDGLIEFPESRFSVRSAVQSVLIPPDWAGYHGARIVKRENRILGTFDRSLAIKREDVLFFASGDAIYDSIILNAMGCGRGRCCAITVNGDYNYFGFIFIYNVQPKLDEVFESPLGAKLLSQFRMLLPLEPLVAFVPLNQVSKEVPEAELHKLLKESWRIRKAVHMGRRGSASGMSSPLESFMMRYPEDEWQSLVTKAERHGRAKAKALFDEQSDLSTAKREMSRIINGFRAECLYFGKDEAIVEERLAVYEAAYRALRRTRLDLDSACLLRMVKKA